MALTRATDRADPFAEVPESLARTSVGDEVLIEGIVCDLVRTLCEDRGIQVGDRLRVQCCEGKSVVVRNVKGRSVRIPASYTTLVRIRHIPEEFKQALAAGE